MSAGEAAGQQAGQGEAAEGQAQDAQQGAPDYAALLESQQQMGSQMEQMREFMQSQPWAQQEEAQAEPEPDLPQLDFLESGDPEFDQQLAQNLQGFVQAEAQKIAQQSLAPMQEQMQQMQRMDQARELVGEFPELNDPEHAQRVIGMSREYAEMMNRPDLADEPQMWRLMHLANAAMVSAQEEKEQSPAAHLEGSGGPGAGQQSQVDLGDLIVNGQGEGAPLGRRALPF